MKKFILLTILTAMLFSSIGTADVNTSISVSWDNIFADVYSSEVCIYNASLLDAFDEIIIEYAYYDQYSPPSPRIDTFADNGNDTWCSGLSQTPLWYANDTPDILYRAKIVIKHPLCDDGICFVDGNWSVNASINTTYSNHTFFGEKLSSLLITSFAEIYSNGKHKVLELVIDNTGHAALNNISWSMDLGDGTIINSTTGKTLNAGENMSVYVTHTYDSAGSYNINATASSGPNQDSETLVAVTDNLEVTGLSALSSSNNSVIFEFTVMNYLEMQLNSILWSIDFGDGNSINSSYKKTLATNENMSVYVRHDYASADNYTVNASAVNGTLTGYKDITVTI